MSEWTREHTERLADALEGTCSNPEAVVEKLELDAEHTDYEDVLLDVNCERCSECGYWYIGFMEHSVNNEPICCDCMDQMDEVEE